MNGRGSGWILFAMIVLITSGVMRVFDAIWMFNYKGQVPQNLQNAVFGTSLTTYAWIYLIVGIILIAAGVGLASGSQLARWVGIIAGTLMAISAIWWMPYYPIWALAYIVLGVLVVYALAAYGGDDRVRV
jgi:hypothetical protein